jgi:hypothetical protein
MDYASQIVASAKVKCSDREGGNANRDIDHVEEKDGHWGGPFRHVADYKNTFDSFHHDSDRFL